MDRRTAAADALEAIKASVGALSCLVPGPGSTRAGDGDPLRQEADDWLDSMAEAYRLQAATAAFVVHAAAGFTDTTRAMAAPNALPQERMAQEMAIVAEVACVLTVSERAAGALLDHSHALTSTLPLTLSALQEGTISWQHARYMVDETGSLDPAGAAALEAHFLDPVAVDPARGCPAGELVPGRFRAKARTWRERHHAESIEKRHTRSAADRRLEYAPDRDGMAWLSAYLPADQAAGIWDRTTTAARALQGPNEPRTLTQLRADTAATLLLSAGSGSPAGTTDAGITRRTPDPTGTCSGSEIQIDSPSSIAPIGSAAEVPSGGMPLDGVPSPSAQVLVTVPVFALMGLTEEPGVLDGYGPIPASMARTLVADGASSFYRVLTDPRDGAPLEIGRKSYRIPNNMRQWLRMRDGKCPFPGCSNHSLDNDADHILAWAQGGTTGISNLGQPCPKHHRLKHTTQWKPAGASTDKPPGWISPTGRRYASEEQDWEPPDWPYQILSRLRRQEFSPALPKQPSHTVGQTVPGHPGPDRDRGAALSGDILREDQQPDHPLPEDPFPERALFPISGSAGV